MVRARKIRPDMQRGYPPQYKRIKGEWMSIGPHLNDKVKFLIAEVWNCDRARPAKLVTAAVQKELCERPKDFGLDGGLRPDWPGVSAVQKELTQIRKRDENRPEHMKGLDKPWSMGALDEYPIPPDAVAKILELKVKNLPYLTIRTARWISRLSSLPLSVDVLYVFAWIAGYNEKTFDLAGLPRNTDTSWEISLLAILQNPDRARWTRTTWAQPLSESPGYRHDTQAVLLNFGPFLIPPTLEELEANPTPEYENWKAHYYTEENQKTLKDMRRRQWQRK